MVDCVPGGSELWTASRCVLYMCARMCVCACRSVRAEEGGEIHVHVRVANKCTFKWMGGKRWCSLV